MAGGRSSVSGFVPVLACCGSGAAWIWPRRTSSARIRARRLDVRILAAVPFAPFLRSFSKERKAKGRRRTRTSDSPRRPPSGKAARGISRSVAFRRTARPSVFRGTVHFALIRRGLPPNPRSSFVSSAVASTARMLLHSYRLPLRFAGQAPQRDVAHELIVYPRSMPRGTGTISPAIASDLSSLQPAGQDLLRIRPYETGFRRYVDWKATAKSVSSRSGVAGTSSSPAHCLDNPRRGCFDGVL